MMTKTAKHGAPQARLDPAAEIAGSTAEDTVRSALQSAIERAESQAGATPPGAPVPFLAFARTVEPQDALRARITAAYRRPEPECAPWLIEQARLAPALAAKASETARKLVEALRAKAKRGVVEGLLQEYSLSSQEGVALMCLAEALLRIPDAATRDALIRDKIALGDWASHAGQSPSLFVNAATWGLVVTGRLTSTTSQTGLSRSLTRLIGKGGEPLVRKGTDLAMRMMGEQFVTGQTIDEALVNSRKQEARGFTYSYDMLGEAAMTAADGARYYREYEQAIHAIGAASNRRGIYLGPGISIKLSALHPRYARAQRERVMAEVLPRLLSLTVLARSYDIGINIDAEEADRLDLSLDLLEALCLAPELQGWNGVGFVIQAYQKRAPFVVDYVIDLARRTGRRLMVRLVKGAYWDSEIKRAQIDGLDGFPVYTRKVTSDLSYLTCARRLLKAPDAVFPQFATHNAQTLAAVHAMAGDNYYAGQYEFQCLHGMGEPLYEEVVGADKLNRPCRIYAPVGTHETLLAYLVRRLLENGANTSFVNRISDPAVPIADLIADPVTVAEAIEPIGAPHPLIALPRDLFRDRPNSKGLDLSNERSLASLAAALLASANRSWKAVPMLGDGTREGEGAPVRNPADQRDVVGTVVEASLEEVKSAFELAQAAAPMWRSTPSEERGAGLLRAADLMESRTEALVGVLVREAGKSFANAVSEVREAVDFLRYYATQAMQELSGDALGPIVCISPWNFPLAIFTGQVAAALAAGNPVLAKPAEETPLIAARAIEILREAGVPASVVQLLPGAGEIGAALVADPRAMGVMFTGSTEVARLIQRELARRLTPEGETIPLIAETGGLNALIVDSSALAEQVVADAILSAFDSAGQRCSALRVLCLQEDIADRTLEMLKGAMAELSIGNPDRLSTDVGPVITAEARDRIREHVEAMRQKGFAVDALPLPDACAHGAFVAPTIIEISRFGDVEREVFGPVLHVLRYKRDELDALVDAINGAGYGLTFGLHTRIDETIARVTSRIGAGNVYVNRNIVGAVVGVQPFGGNGMSGTGPKAGGPLYLKRLRRGWGTRGGPDGHEPTPAIATFVAWLERTGRADGARKALAISARSPLRSAAVDLPGPVGERNVYGVKPRGDVLASVESEAGLVAALASAFAAGNAVTLRPSEGLRETARELSQALEGWVTLAADDGFAPPKAALYEGDSAGLLRLAAEAATWPGGVASIHAVSPERLAAGEVFPLDWLIEEKVIATNTAAAGGNASLMTIG